MSRIATIKRITKLDTKLEKFDITVEDNHNFFANNILVHNCCLKAEGVFARSHGQETRCSSFNYIKNVHYYPNRQEIIESNIQVFGENMYAIHSIEYTNLQDYFYMFNIVDRNKDEFMAIDDVIAWAESHNMLMVPEVYRGEIPSLQWLEKFLEDESKKQSALGG